jgi:putative flavoprotein involved in K+ transport
VEAGVERAPRVAGVSRGLPVLEDGRVLNIASVIWSTGFRHDFRWIRLPVFDPVFADGKPGVPIHHRGVVQSEPGLFFTGLPFQSSLLSGHVAGAGEDAKYVVGQMARRARTAGPAYGRKPTGKQHQDYRDLQAE